MHVFMPFKYFLDGFAYDPDQEFVYIVVDEC